MELIRVYFSLFHHGPNLFLLTLVLPVHKTLLFDIVLFYVDNSLYEYKFPNLRRTSILEAEISI